MWWPVRRVDSAAVATSRSWHRPFWRRASIDVSEKAEICVHCHRDDGTDNDVHFNHCDAGVHQQLTLGFVGVARRVVLERWIEKELR